MNVRFFYLIILDQRRLWPTCAISELNWWKCYIVIICCIIMLSVLLIGKRHGNTFAMCKILQMSSAWFVIIARYSIALCCRDATWNKCNSCADPGIFVSGGGGGGGPGQSNKKSSDNVFLVLSLFYRSQMVNFRETYRFSRFQRGSNIFQGGFIRKKRAHVHNLYPAKSVEDFNCLNYISIANIFALTFHIDFSKICRFYFLGRIDQGRNA